MLTKKVIKEMKTQEKRILSHLKLLFLRCIIVINKMINTFISENLLSKEKSWQFHLEKAVNLTHDIFAYQFKQENLVIFSCKKLC